MFKNHSKGTAKLPNCIYLLYLWWRTQQCMVSTNKCHLAAQSSDPTCFLQLLEHKIVKLTPKMNKNDLTWKNGTSFKTFKPPSKNLPAETHGAPPVPVQSQFWQPRGDIVVGCWTPKWWNFVVLVAASVGKTTQNWPHFPVCGWTTHPQKYGRQNENLPQIGVNIQIIFETTTPVFDRISKDAPQLTLQLWHETFRTWVLF